MLNCHLPSSCVCTTEKDTRQSPDCAQNWGPSPACLINTQHSAHLENKEESFKWSWKVNYNQQQFFKKVTVTGDTWESMVQDSKKLLWIVSLTEQFTCCCVYALHAQRISCKDFWKYSLSFQQTLHSLQNGNDRGFCLYLVLETLV